MRSRPILLIEDNSDDAFFMRRAFAAAGIENDVAIATNGDEAIAYLSRPKTSDDLQRPFLALLDLKLPYRNGFAVLEFIRAHKDFKTLAVVVLTSSNEPCDVSRAFDLGANAYVVKPGAYKELVTVVVAIRDFWLLYHPSAA